MFARRAAALATVLALAAVVAHAATTPARKPARPASTPAPAASRPATPPPAAAPAARPADGAEAIDAVAAMVNDEAVLVSDVEEQLYLFLQQVQSQGGRLPDSSQVDTLRRQVLDQMIDDKLLAAEAKRQGIVVADADLDRAVDQDIAGARQRMGSDAAFQEQLKREGLTESQLRDRFRNDRRKLMMIERLKMKQFPKRTVTQAEAETYFKEHKDRFPRMPAEVHLQVIQIRPEPDSGAVAAGRARIEAIRKRLLAGEKFAKVAAETSEDPGSANAGGDLGFNVRGRMVKEFDDASFSLKLNEISQPLHTQYGWHVLQVLDRDTVRTVAGRDSLDEAGKPLLEAHVRHILIRVQPTEADVARAAQLAAHVRDEARKGTDYATLVRRYSRYEGPTNADGDVGFISLGTLQPSIRAGLDTLEIGQVSDVLENQSGFNLFKVVDRHPERDYTLEEVRDQLPDYVANMQRQDRYDAWLKTLRAKAQIEYR